MPPKTTQRRPVIDKAVAEILSEAQQKTEERSLTVDERDRRKKEREKAKSRNRVMLDLPPEIEARIKAIADTEKCPASQVAAILIWQGLKNLDDGTLDLDQYKRTSRSPRYSWNLVFLSKAEKDDFC